MKKTVIFFFALLSLFYLVFAQETKAENNNDIDQIDELFSGKQDVIAPENPSGVTIDHTAVFTEKPKLHFSGSISSTAALAVGYTQWPDPNNLLLYYDGSAGATATTTLVMNAQPSTALSVYGSVSSTLDTSGSLSWSQFAIGSLYFDYYGISNISIRAGQFSTNWGHGRIFTLSNLMSSSGSDISMRISFPLVLQGLSFFVLANQSYFSAPGGTPAVSEYVYAGSIDHIIGPIRITEALRFQKKEGLRSLSSVQGTVLGLDLFSDVIFAFDLADQVSILKSWGYVGGVFKEFLKTRIYGEYQYTSETAGNRDHTIAFVFLQRKLWDKPIDAGFKWEHTFYDYSGSFIPGLTWSLLPHGTLQIAIPVTYGPEGSRYVTNNNDPSKRKVMLALLFKIEGSF